MTDLVISVLFSILFALVVLDEVRSKEGILNREIPAFLIAVSFLFFLPVYLIVLTSPYVGTLILFSISLLTYSFYAFEVLCKRGEV